MAIAIRLAELQAACLASPSYPLPPSVGMCMHVIYLFLALNIFFVIHIYSINCWISVDIYPFPLVELIVTNYLPARHDIHA